MILANAEPIDHGRTCLATAHADRLSETKARDIDLDYEPGHGTFVRIRATGVDR